MTAAEGMQFSDLGPFSIISIYKPEYEVNTKLTCDYFVFKHSLLLNGILFCTNELKIFALVINVIH